MSRQSTDTAWIGEKYAAVIKPELMRLVQGDWEGPITLGRYAKMPGGALFLLHLDDRWSVDVKQEGDQRWRATLSFAGEDVCDGGIADSEAAALRALCCVKRAVAILSGLDAFPIVNVPDSLWLHWYVYEHTEPIPVELIGGGIMYRYSPALDPRSDRNWSHQEKRWRRAPVPPESLPPSEEPVG